jgi:glycine cleavage system T protein
MQKQADLVIIGAGIVGCSAAYHLAERGWRDIVVLDQGPLFETGGSTSHAPGLVFQTNASKTMTQLAKYTVHLYSQLELDGQPCFYPVGGMEVAYTPQRWEDLKRKAGYAKSWGLEAMLITPEEARQKIPILDSTKIHGAYFVPTDGIAKAVRAAEALARHSEARGVVFYGQAPVNEIEVADGRVQAVITPQGRVATEKVLVCAGIWGPRLGRMAGTSIPLTPVEHQYVRTGPIPELAGETREVVHPILRHQDRSMYFRQHADSYGIGSYQHEPLLVEPNEIVSYEEALVMPSITPFTAQHFEKAWASAVDLLPALHGAELIYKINGMFSFTPDGQPLFGEALEVRGLWVAEAVWVTHAGGAGKVIAEWMAEGVPSLDLRECDVNRFHPHAHGPSYIRARGAQQYREVYDIIHPLQQIKNPRNVRCSPFHSRLEALGAVFFENAGWERPQWFESNQRLLEGHDWPARSSWEARYWSPIQGGEHQATRQQVAMYDLTPFTKIEVNGPGALDFLQHLAANQMNRPVGTITYTSMLNEQGGIVCDLTVTRLASDQFLIVTGAGVGMHDLAWMRGHLPANGSAHMVDVTSSYACIGLWGPSARDLLRKVSEDDLSNQAFPYMTSRRLMIGDVPALALRISYVGELGWEIYTPTEYGLRLWDTLWAAGEALNVVAAGGGAFESLRLEKGYRLWGADIHTEYNPYEAGLGFAVKLDKGDFLGREALRRVRQQGVTRRLCCMTLEDPHAVVMGKEPILDGARVLGYVTSANYGYTIGKAILYGYLPVDYQAEGTTVEVEYFGRRLRACMVREPLYDPEHTRLRS